MDRNDDHTVEHISSQTFRYDLSTSIAQGVRIGRKLYHSCQGVSCLIPADHLAVVQQVEQTPTDAQLTALLHSPNIKMTAGGMTSVDLKQDEMEELSAYLRLLH